MIVFKRGTKMPPKYLTAVLQDRHDTLRKQQAERLAKRKARGVPASDAKPCEHCGHAVEEEPIGPFEGLEYLDGLRVVFRAIPLGDVRAYRLRQLEAATKIADGDIDGLVAAERSSSEVKRAAVVDLVASIDGLANEDGSDLAMPAGDKLTDAELDILEDNAILDALFTAGLHLQDLTDEARKNSGASQRSTSAHTTATLAQTTDANPGDATTSTGPVEAGPMTSTSAPMMADTTQPAHAQNGSYSETPISDPPSSSSHSSVMLV